MFQPQNYHENRMVATAKIGKQKYHFQKKLRMNSQKIIITITQNALYLVSFHTNLTFSYMLNNWPTLSHKWHFFYKKICNKGLVWHEIEPLNSRCNRNKPSYQNASTSWDCNKGYILFLPKTKYKYISNSDF